MASASSQPFTPCLIRIFLPFIFFLTFCAAAAYLLLPDILLRPTDNEISLLLYLSQSPTIYRNLLHPLPMNQKTMGIDSIGRTGNQCDLILVGLCCQTV